MTGVLVLGALHHDVVVDAPRLPGLDETLQGSGVDYRFGGKGGNQALAACQMGATVRMAGRVGSDSAAEVILTALDQAGVHRTLVRAMPGETGMSVAVSLPDGTYGAVIVSGVNLSNDGRIDWPSDCGICLLQNEIPERANLDLAARLPADVTLVLNAAPARAVPDALLARTDILVVNRVEARQLCGLDDAQDAARHLLDQGPGAVIVTLGEDGLILAEAGSEPVRQPGFKVDVVSTHGAGDTFVGAMAARLSMGDRLGEAVAFAQGAAALHVSVAIEDRVAVTPDRVTRLLTTEQPR